MNRWIVGIAASAALLVCAARETRAQAAASWPRVGARLVRLEEAPMTETTLPARNGKAPVTVSTPQACARQLRDARTGREYLLRHSTMKQNFAQHEAGDTTITTSRLLAAEGEYSRIELKGDTLSTRVVTVDCVTSRVVARSTGT